jgi:hypothetical protein
MDADSFLGFLGWFVSEGNTECGKRIRITQKDDITSKKIFTLCENIGLNTVIYKEVRDDSNYINRIFSHSASLVRWLDVNCGRGAANKKVPEFIKALSARQIKIFLDTLFNGDGSKNSEHPFGYSTYATKSKQLADDVQEILLKIGYPSTIHYNETKDIYMVGVRGKYIKPYLLHEPKISQYVGKIWCVRVPNGVIYARRNGNAIWTGNSYRLQKHVETTSYTELKDVAMRSKDTPTIKFILMGHLHIQVQAMFGPIFGAQCGCFEGQTNLLKQMGVTPTIGGYIIRAIVDKNGMLKRIIPDFRMFPEIKDDWKNYVHPIPEDSLTKYKTIPTMSPKKGSVDD